MNLENSVFVYGSNELGIHGKGAALYAAKFRGAKNGIGRGREGMSYGIPTKKTPTSSRTILEIARDVDIFFTYAVNNPQEVFQITKVGCGLAGIPEEIMRDMFVAAPSNCLLPGTWLRANYQNGFTATNTIRIIVAGSRDILDRKRIYDYLDCELKPIKDKYTIVSGLARGPDQIGYEWAADNRIKRISFPAKWNEYPGKIAGMIRNQQMAWYSTHLVAFWDNKSTGTKNMIDIATAYGLKVKIIPW